MASRIISRHHWNIDNIMVVVPSKSNIASLKCSQLISPRAMNMALMAEVKGHGLSSTKW